MKTLKGFIILYDAVCPLCQAYTQLFVQTGLLEKAGRASYQQMPSSCVRHVDQTKAVNEIALVNPATGEVYYGVESLLKIMAKGFPILESVFKWKPLVFILKKLYRFISYNRRIILPVAINSENPDMRPAFHKGYRIAFLGLSWVLVTLLVHWYGTGMQPLVPASSSVREFMICGAQIIWQALFINWWAPDKKWDYLGNMMVVSLLGGLALLPLGWLFQIAGAAPQWYVAGFLGVAGAMLLEHIRRSRLLALDGKLTVSWVAYRIVVLILLLQV